MGLFDLRTGPILQLGLDADPGLFYKLGSGHAIFKEKTAAGELTKGAQIPLSCMFQAYWLLRGKDRVGYYFVSQFQVDNRGGYLVTYLNNGAGKADSVEVMLKTEHLVVFHYPNRGTLIISPSVSEDVQTIFQEQ